MATAVENLINKSAAEKDAKMMANATAKINAAPTSLPAAPAEGADPAAKPGQTDSRGYHARPGSPNGASGFLCPLRYGS